MRSAHVGVLERCPVAQFSSFLASLRLMKVVKVAAGIGYVFGGGGGGLEVVEVMCCGEILEKDTTGGSFGWGRG